MNGYVLLFAATGFAVLLPMLPALAEWHRPTDRTALYIDTSDGLDPPYLARAFADRLARAVAAGQTELGPASIATLPSLGVWPLTAAERSAATSGRIWRTTGDLTLPPDMNFSAEAVAGGTLHTAPGRSYRALWAARQLRLAARTTVTHWARGASVEIAAGCRLLGPISADERITATGHASFKVLHAPTVQFGIPAAPRQGPGSAPPAAPPDGLEPLIWNAAARRGVSGRSLDIRAFSAWQGDIVSHADLCLGTGCNVLGSLKARGVLVADAQCLVDGSVVAEGGIALGDGCVVRGSVISETAVVLGSDCVVGAPGRPATVSAPRIEVGPGVLVHGTLWAAEQGSASARASRPAGFDVASGARPARQRRASA